MSEYLPCHRPENQTRITDGVCINPLLRPGFNSTKHSDRPDQETSDWWNRAYILEQEYEPSDDTYSGYVTRIKTIGAELGFEVIPEEEWNLTQKENLQLFLNAYSDGKAYTVRILDGGCHDRSSNKGSYPTLDDALAVAKQIK